MLERGPEKWPPFLWEAAGAQIAQSEILEAVTINNNTMSYNGLVIGMSMM